MFVLCELKHLIKLAPRGFDQPLEGQIKDELNSKLANRVLIKGGLCLALYDLLHVGESHVLPGDGSAHTEVSQRFVVRQSLPGFRIRIDLMWIRIRIRIQHFL